MPDVFHRSCILVALECGRHLREGWTEPTSPATNALSSPESAVRDYSGWSQNPMHQRPWLVYAPNAEQLAEEIARPHGSFALATARPEKSDRGNEPCVANAKCRFSPANCRPVGREQSLETPPLQRGKCAPEEDDPPPIRFVPVRIYP